MINILIGIAILCVLGVTVAAFPVLLTLLAMITIVALILGACWVVGAFLRELFS